MNRHLISLIVCLFLNPFVSTIGIKRTARMRLGFNIDPSQNEQFSKKFYDKCQKNSMYLSFTETEAYLNCFGPRDQFLSLKGTMNYIGVYFILTHNSKELSSQSRVDIKGDMLEFMKQISANNNALFLEDENDQRTTEQKYNEVLHQYGVKSICKNTESETGTTMGFMMGTDDAGEISLSILNTFSYRSDLINLVAKLDIGKDMEFCTYMEERDQKKLVEEIKRWGNSVRLNYDANQMLFTFSFGKLEKPITNSINESSQKTIEQVSSLEHPVEQNFDDPADLIETNKLVV